MDHYGQGDSLGYSLKDKVFICGLIAIISMGILGAIYKKYAVAECKFCHKKDFRHNLISYDVVINGKTVGGFLSHPFDIGLRFHSESVDIPVKSSRMEIRGKNSFLTSSSSQEIDLNLECSP